MGIAQYPGRADCNVAGPEFHVHPEDPPGVGAAPEGGRRGQGVWHAQLGQGWPGVQGTAQGAHLEPQDRENALSCSGLQVVGSDASTMPG